MEQIISSLIKSLSRYEFINNLIPGVLLCYILKHIGYDFIGNNWFTNLIVGYYAGLINSRFSSLIIEEICRKLSFIEWRDYDSYNKAKESRPFITTMQELANMYRALTSVFIIALLALLYKKISIYCIWLDNNDFWIGLILLLILFLCSYRKQVNNYVIKNIDEVKNEKERIEK